MLEETKNSMESPLLQFHGGFLRNPRCLGKKHKGGGGVGRHPNGRAMKIHDVEALTTLQARRGRKKGRKDVQGLLVRHNHPQLLEKNGGDEERS